jgi:lipopolysaccharide export system protein LptC
LNTRFLAGLAIAAAIVAVLWLGSKVGDNDSSRATEALDETDPGYAARDAEVIETDTTGRELYRLNAELIRQDPASGIVELEAIKMNYRTATSAVWKVDAQQGTVATSGTEILLRGQVRVAGPIGEPGRELQLDTDKLTIDTQRELVTTDATVVMTWEGQVLRARGMVANLKTERVRLESKVNGRFIP